jgi:hypothetical protein
MSEDMKTTREPKARKRPEPVVSRENAIEQFEIFKEYCEVYPDDVTSVAKKCKQVEEEVLKSVMAGSLEFVSGSEVLVRQHLREIKGAPAGPLEWKPEKLGVAKHAIPVATGEKLANEYKKLHALIAGMTGIDSGMVSKMHALDQSTSEVIAGLFLSI